MKLFIIVFVICAAPATPVAGQLFPYDRIDSIIVLAPGDEIVVMLLDDHRKVFGDVTVTLEVYFEPHGVIPDYSSARTDRCLETVFVNKKQVKGTFKYPFKKSGRYIFLFYREGCYLEQCIQFGKEGIGYSFVKFGNCTHPPGRIRKS